MKRLQICEEAHLHTPITSYLHILRIWECVGGVTHDVGVRFKSQDKAPFINFMKLFCCFIFFTVFRFKAEV